MSTVILFCRFSNHRKEGHKEDNSCILLVRQNEKGHQTVEVRQERKNHRHVNQRLQHGSCVLNVPPYPGKWSPAFHAHRADARGTRKV